MRALCRLSALRRRSEKTVHSPLDKSLNRYVGCTLVRQLNNRGNGHATIPSVLDRHSCRDRRWLGGLQSRRRLASACRLREGPAIAPHFSLQGVIRASAERPPTYFVLRQCSFTPLPNSTWSSERRPSFVYLKADDLPLLPDNGGFVVNANRHGIGMPALPYVRAKIGPEACMPSAASHWSNLHRDFRHAVRGHPPIMKQRRGNVSG